MTQTLPLKRVCHNVVQRNAGNRPFVALEHVESGTGRVSEDHTWIESDEEQFLEFEPGDVLFGKLRPYLRKVLLTDRAGCCVSEFLVLRPLPGVYSRYLYWLLQSREVSEYAVLTSEGAKMPRTSWDKLNGVPVQLPKPERQDAIADHLDRETARIDALLQTHEKAIGLLEEHRTAAISRVITTGLNGAALLPTPSRWLPLLPEHWRVSRLLHLLDRNVPLVYGILLPGPRLDDGVPYIGAGDVVAGRLNLEELPRTEPVIASQYPRSRMRAGELVYAIRGSFGHVAVLPPELDGCNLSRDAARLAPAPGVHPAWLCYALKADPSQAQFRHREAGIAVTGVNIRDLKRVEVPVPPLKEQLEIARHLEAMEELVARAVVAEARQVSLLRERRLALITAAINGQVGVPTPEAA
jgi:type I restriction enzyme S subunit